MKTALRFLMFFPLFSFAAPMKSMVGADGSEIVPPADDCGIPYVAEGLVYWWDGINGIWEDTNWIDLVSGVAMLRSPRGNGPYVVNYNPVTYVQQYKTKERMDRDFTLHSFIELPAKGYWGNWCIMGIGTAPGNENGITLFGENTFRVIYRKTYSGTILNSIPLTGIAYGSTIVLDIVFRYADLTYEVYVDGEFYGESMIAETDWNLNGVDCNVGTYFYSKTTQNENMKRYDVLFYNRALS